MRSAGKMADVQIAVLAGGIGAARFLRGLKAETAAGLAHADIGGSAGSDGPGAPTEITVIGNTGDDITLFGLRVCPDLDTVMYTLGGGIEESQGWGRAADSFTVQDELAAYGMEPRWFRLGDLDIATHIVRTRMLDAGYPLSQVTEALCARWDPGVRLIPMSDDRVETHVVIAADDESARRAVHFQEWWVRMHAETPALEIIPVGAEDAKPAPGVLDAIADADVVVLPPSNPVVSIGTILSVPGIRDAIANTAAPVVGVSPIIGGAPVRGMADACLQAVGVETSAAAVAGLYSGLIDGWLVDPVDAAHTTQQLSSTGVKVHALPLYMNDETTTRAIARATLDVAAELAGDGRGKRQ
jgi:LPPG:FO 2-phospho-L-lactate transferase